VTLRAVVISAPTPAALDSTSAIVAGDTLAAVGYLKSGVASSFTLATKGDSVTGTTLGFQLAGVNRVAQGMHSEAFRTAGSYVVDIWVDASGHDVTLTSGNNNSVGEAVLRTTISIGGSPTKMALSATSATNAGTSGSAVGVTLKDANDVPTLIAGHLNESMTVRTTLGSLTTETVTVRRGTALAFNDGAREADSVTVQSRVGGFTTPNFANVQLPTGQSLVVVGSNESITASTGSYDYRVNHSGAMLSTIGFNLTHAPLAADLAFTFSTVAGAEVKTIKVTNASGVHQESTTALGTPVATGSTDNNEVYTAPTSIETATRVNYQVNPSVTTVGLALTGTAADVVNVTVSGSTVTGVANGTTQVTLDSTGAGTVNFSGSAPVAGNTYTVTIAESASGTANLSTILIFTYTASRVQTEDWGKNGISSNLLSSTVVAAGVVVGSTTDVKVTVKDQYGTPQQYYPVKGILSATSRNVANVFTTQYTDASGIATVTLKDASTSTTNLTDVLQVGIADKATPTVFDRITATKDILTLSYSATGAYASLAVTGGTTALVTKTVPVETADAHAAAEVTLVPSLKNAAGTAITGVALTWTASDGVYFRATALTRPTTGDVKTITTGSGVSVFAYGTKPGVATVTVTGGGQTTTATFTVAAVIASTARSVSATAASGRVTATVKDGWGNPVPGVTVSFAADNKGIFGSGVSSTSAITDAAGLASALVQSADATGADVAVIASITGAQQADLVDSPVTGFAAGVASVTVTAKPTAGAASTDTAITAVKTDVATANAAVKALATQVTVLQASVATLIDSLTTQIASLMKSVSALTKAVAKLQTATKKK
jgi:adhesin/invasin